MKILHPAPLTLCLSLLAISCARAAAPPLAAPPADAANYRRLGAEAETNLQRQVLAMWFPRALDRQKGGFVQNFNEDWSPGVENAKSIVYQARLTWVAAQAARRYPAQSATYAAYSRHGLDFLLSGLWDKQNGGFFWEVDSAGQPLREGEKHAYGIAFGIYAACANYRATRDPRALELARRAFAWLDVHAHDRANGGYFEALTRAGQPILAPPGVDQSNDVIGTRYGFKSMNSHIHLLEAFTALYEVWPDRRLRARLEEIFAVVRDKIAVEPVGCLNLFFTPDWKALPDHDSFGHDVETAYLLVEASTALGRPNDARTWALARRIVDHALAFGWDTENGGLYDAGRTFGGPFITEKIWWVQAESLNALLLMHEKFGAQSPRYWAAFNRQWEFIQNHQIDAAHGGWQGTVTREGASLPGRAKSDAWTEGYHQGRALMNVADTLRHLAGDR